MGGATIRVNGRDEVLACITLAELMAARGVEAQTRGIAVALNGRVVPRGQWDETRLAAGDAVEIVRAMKGG